MSIESEAMNILHAVVEGRVKPADAAKLLSELYGEQHQRKDPDTDMLRNIQL